MGNTSWRSGGRIGHGFCDGGRVGTVFCGKVGPQFCWKVGAEFCGKVGPELCGKVGPEFCGKVGPEFCGKVGQVLLAARSMGSAPGRRECCRGVVRAWV